MSKAAQLLTGVTLVARKAVDEIVLTAVRLIGDHHDVAPITKSRERFSLDLRAFWQLAEVPRTELRATSN